MLCFEVSLNGKKLCLAGVGESGVLSAIVSWVGGLPLSPRKRGRTRAGQADLHVGGLYDREPHIHVHPRWVGRRLRLGDEVSIRIVQGTSPDEATEHTVQTDDEIREQQRKYYLRVRDQFETGDANDRSRKGVVLTTKLKPTRRKSRK
jgi:hypothetical protein